MFVSLKVSPQNLTVVPEGEDWSPGVTNRGLDLAWSVPLAAGNVGVRLEVCVTW